MKTLSLKGFTVPMIKAIDRFNYLLKSHHRRVAVISYYLGKQLNLDDTELSDLVLAASLHDIGALSVRVKEMIGQEEVENPLPHSIMGAHILSFFKPFEAIVPIVLHHHIYYMDSPDSSSDEVSFQSHILHLADRVDIFMSPDLDVLNHGETVINSIRESIGTRFHPDAFSAFEQVVRQEAFWSDLKNLDFDELFEKFNFLLQKELTIEDVTDFSLMLSKVIDYRSQYTLSHSYTVAHVAALIGSYFGFTEERCKKLLVAGYLHDIGKLEIDPRIVEKKGVLNSHESNLMRMHVYYTGKILSTFNKSDWFSEVILWSERHHEKSDGRGYPFSLKGKSLDDGAKILAYSDIISALMEKRPYRRGLSIDVTCDVIRNKIAETLSPDMFAVIENHKDEISALVSDCQTHIYEEYNDTLETISSALAVPSKRKTSDS